MTELVGYSATLQTLIGLPEQNNCLHEIFFEEALARAADLDRYLSEHGRPVGALHGLPVSLKDQFYVKGVDTTMGYVGWIDTFEGNRDPKKVHNVESQVVNELYSTGAVLYCKVLPKGFKRNSLYLADIR
jgi:amidase